MAIILGFIFEPLLTWRQKLVDIANQKRSVIAPLKKEIYKHYKGEEAHKHLINSYKEHDINIFFELKPILPLIIQIPVIIVFFHSLGNNKILLKTNQVGSYSDVFGIPLDLFSFSS